MKKHEKLTVSSEYAHTANEKPDWRESYYFNWVDLEAGISGFSTIGLLPNIGKREFVFALFYRSEREVYFQEPDGHFSDDLLESLTDGILTYKLIEPLKEWHIFFNDDKLKADIKWPCRFPVYDFGTGSGTSWAGHFEQSGSPYGRIEFSDGKIINFRGLGERDKSWGSRDWHIESWFALHAQFDELSIGLRRDEVKGEAHCSGGISSADGHIPIETIDFATETHSDHGIPIGAKTRIVGTDGSVYNIRSHLINPNSYVRFAREFHGGTTELFEGMVVHTCKELGASGTGLVEWLFTHLEKRK
ncbi:hypothetical protein EU527_02975 [Candidatus Thorarchaeota archaeon]|nr:MAG: hypothetical protein EU527_02975 [Candidatus Thorarchaeota archaeon]